MIALDKKLPAILKGETQPADAAEQVSFAKLCTLKNRHADAARFYADAFAAKPALADDAANRHRYNAACASALAAAGQGEDATNWTTRNAPACAGRPSAGCGTTWPCGASGLESGTPQARATVQQETPALAGGSRPGRRARRGRAGEAARGRRADWKKLWADVDALLKNIGDSGRK